MSEEIQENLDHKLQDRNRHRCRCHLLRELRNHTTCVYGSTSNQESTTNILLKFRRKWANCFDMIVLSFEKTESACAARHSMCTHNKFRRKWPNCFEMIVLSFEKTEQLNSKFWHRWFPHNSSLLRIVQHGLLVLRYLQRGGGPKKRFQYRVPVHRILIQPRLFFTVRTFEQFKAILEDTHRGGQNGPALQDNVLLPSDFAESSTTLAKLPRHALHHPVGWKRCQERDTDGILHNRESYVRTSTQAAGFRRDEAQNCSLQTKFWEYIRIQCSGPIWELLRRRDWRTTKQVLTRTSFATLSQQRVLRQWW